MQRDLWIMRRQVTESETGTYLRIEFSETDPATIQPGMPVNTMPAYVSTLENPNDADMALYARGAKFTLSIAKA